MGPLGWGRDFLKLTTNSFLILSDGGSKFLSSTLHSLNFKVTIPQSWFLNPQCLLKTIRNKFIYYPFTHHQQERTDFNTADTHQF